MWLDFTAKTSALPSRTIQFRVGTKHLIRVARLMTANCQHEVMNNSTRPGAEPSGWGHHRSKLHQQENTSSLFRSVRSWAVIAASILYERGGVQNLKVLPQSVFLFSSCYKEPRWFELQIDFVWRPVGMVLSVCLTSQCRSGCFSVPLLTAPLHQTCVVFQPFFGCPVFGFTRCSSCNTPCFVTVLLVEYISTFPQCFLACRFFFFFFKSSWCDYQWIIC